MGPTSHPPVLCRVFCAMAFPWFRFYTEWADDPKVQMLSEAYQRRLAMLFCYQGQGWLSSASDQELSFKLRISLDELENTRAAFQEKGFIAQKTGWTLTNWAKRQRESDDSTARVRKHRMKRSETVTVTEPIVSVKHDETNVTVQEERRGEEIRREQKRLEEKRKAAGAHGKRGGEMISLSSIFSNGFRPSPSPLPLTRAEMIAGGYTFSNKAPCKGCGEEIEWWSSPKGARLPMNVMTKDPSGAIIHLETCSSSAEFRKAQA